jgi:hypothetical protein
MVTSNRVGSFSSSRLKKEKQPSDNLVSQTPWPPAVRRSSHDDYRIDVPLEDVESCRVISPIVLLLTLSFSSSRALLAAIKRLKEFADVAGDDEAVVELFVSTENAFELSNFIEGLAATQRSRSLFASVLSAAKNFRHRGNDRLAMSILSKSSGDMSEEQTKIWRVLHDLRVELRGLVAAYGQPVDANKLDSLGSGDFLPAIFDTCKYNSVLNSISNRSWSTWPELNSKDIQQLDSKYFLHLSIVQLYHSFIAMQALSISPSSNIADLCLSDYDPSHEIALTSQRISFRVVTQVLQTTSSEGRAPGYAPRGFTGDSYGNRRGVRYQFDESSSSRSASFPESIIAPVSSTDSFAEGSTGGAQSGNFSPLEYVPPSSSSPRARTRANSAASSSWADHIEHNATLYGTLDLMESVLEDTECRLLFCSALSSILHRSSYGVAPVENGPIVLTLNMLISRCLRRLVEYVAATVRSECESAVGKLALPSGVSSAIAIQDREAAEDMFLSRAAARHQQQQQLSQVEPTAMDPSLATAAREAELSHRFSVTQGLMWSPFLPFSKELISANGRLALTVQAITASMRCEVNQSALLSRIADFRKIIRWELKPRAESWYKWCGMFCRLDLFLYAEVDIPVLFLGDVCVDLA